MNFFPHFFLAKCTCVKSFWVYLIVRRYVINNNKCFFDRKNRMKIIFWAGCNSLKRIGKIILYFYIISMKLYKTPFENQIEENVRE